MTKINANTTFDLVSANQPEFSALRFLRSKI